jgi:hypothetical protein
MGTRFYRCYPHRCSNGRFPLSDSFAWCLPVWEPILNKTNIIQIGKELLSKVIKPKFHSFYQPPKKGVKKMVVRMNDKTRQKPDTLISENGESITALFFPEEYEWIRFKAFENRSSKSEILRKIVRAAMESENKKNN